MVGRARSTWMLEPGAMAISGNDMTIGRFVGPQAGRAVTRRTTPVAASSAPAGLLAVSAAPPAGAGAAARGGVGSAGSAGWAVGGPSFAPTPTEAPSGTLPGLE